MIKVQKDSFAVSRNNALTPKLASAAPIRYQRNPQMLRPKAADGAADYYDGIASEYDDFYRDALSQGENLWVGTQLKRIVQAGSRVLDLGCGTGLGFQLLDGTGADYVGLDISPGMIAVARERFGHRAIFALGDMAKMSVEIGNRYDIVMSLFGSFSHVLEPERAVAAIARSCKPGARIFIMVYSRFSLHNLARVAGMREGSSLASVRSYSVRNSRTASGSAKARSYTARELRTLFGGFRNLKIMGLNATFELGAVKSIARKVLHDGASAERALSVESAALRYMPNLCHSLVVTGIRS